MNKGTIIILFLVLLGATLIGGVFVKLPKATNQANGCTVGEVPTESKIITLPAILNPDRAFDGPKEDYGVDTSKQTSYQLIRQNVPMLNDRVIDENVKIEAIFDSRSHTEKYEAANLPGFIVYFPGKYGEVTLEKSFTSKYEGLTKEWRFRQEGIIFLVHTDTNGNPIIRPAKDRKGVERQFWMVDLYQDVEKANDTTRGYTLSEIFACSDNSSNEQTIVLPTQKVGDNKQLQVGTFSLKSSSKGFDAHCKPAIYLYPPTPMNVSVKVHTKGRLTYTDPLYPPSGWNIIAYPDGTIDAQGKIYEYLYYESKVPDSLVSQPKSGYVYSYSELEKNLHPLLLQLGLSDNQTKDFIEYWMKVLPRTPYYFVGVFSEQDLNTFEPLEITPKEDTMIRVRLYFKQLDSLIPVSAPEIQTPQKKGFTVVEWGGMIKLNDGEAFTCLQ